MPRNWKWGHKRSSGYRSGAEEKLAQWLTDQGIQFTYEGLKLEYYKTVRGGVCLNCEEKSTVRQKRSYTPDFVLENGTIIEYKGRLTSSDRTKLLAVKKSNPDVSIRLLFGSDNKLVKNGTKRYSDWACDNDFDFAIGSVPKRWIKVANRSDK